MKTNKKMNEKELTKLLKTCKICYAIVSLTIAICFLLSTTNILKGNESIYSTQFAAWH